MLPVMMVHVYTENEIIKEWFREVRINSGKSRFGYYNITTKFDLTLVCWSVIELAERSLYSFTLPVDNTVFH